MTQRDVPEEEREGPVVRDRRRIDPETGQVRRPPSPQPEQGKEEPAEAVEGELLEAEPIAMAKVRELEELVGERTADLQRLQAEYANYKKRVDRDRALSRQGGVEVVISDLLPVLDSIEAARQHGELDGGFKLVADELERLAAKHGVEVFGEPGDAFDPMLHEALMQMPYEAGPVAEPTVAAVMQRGVRVGDKVLRPARVGVAQPATEE
ncbi:nucleotide exchange factor GrpE [Propionicicella superfundia]|uniref:nucleotide exchange factor GrpE n=1 Tax=Propionicicella superfundia TaxID=348582 RepID=UPI00040F98C3